jgi:hypothetical protein
MGFYDQTVELKQLNTDRVEWFISLCKDKKVLHIGCVDWPVFNPESNLHMTLSKHTKELVGVDTNVEGLQDLHAFCGGRYLTELTTLGKEQFDVVLVPETIEHVLNAGDFMKQLMLFCKFKTLVITAPNAMMTEPSKVWNDSKYDKLASGKCLFTEVVHPDHKCWYSPYTLMNLVKTCCDEHWEIEEVGTLCNTSMVYVKVKQRDEEW